MDRNIQALCGLVVAALLIGAAPAASQTVRPDDPTYPTWPHIQTRTDEAWQHTTGSADVTIAIIDSGIDKNHPELAGRVIGGIDYITGEPWQGIDPYGHGTTAALVAAAAGNNGVGSVGVCWNCALLDVRVLDRPGGRELSEQETAEGIIWAIDHGADVINISLSWGSILSGLDDAIDYARDRDVIVVVGAGNRGEYPMPVTETPGGGESSWPTYPSMYPYVLSVAANGSDGARHYYSSYGYWVDVTAPSCLPAHQSHTFRSTCGTSFSAPYVAGVAALARSVSNAPAATIVETIERTSSDVRYVKHGIVDAAATIRELLGVPDTGPLPARSDAPSTCHGEADSHYVDVGGGVHAAAIGCATGHGYLNGRADGRFDPHEPLSLAQAAAVQARVVTRHGASLPDELLQVISRGGVHDAALEQLAGAGIIDMATFAEHLPGPRYGVGNPISRGVLAGQVARTYEYVTRRTLPNSPAVFTDLDDHHPAHALATVGILNGHADGTFRPDQPLTRAQAATILMRLHDAVVHAR